MKASLLLAGTAVIVVFARPLAAQVGSGWTVYAPGSSIQLDGANGIESYPGDSTELRNEGASFTNQGGVETFALHDPVSNRAERRMRNTYLGGAHQFEGEVRVSPPTNDESIMQIFGGNSGATTQMIRAFADAGGNLRKIPGSVRLIDNIYGVWVRVNVVHDVGANVVRTYINGQLAATGDGEAVDAGDDGWYHKYGCYGTLRTGSAKVEWRNVKHFRQGGVPSDGGAADAGMAEDAGAGDAGGGDGSVDAPGGGSGAGGGAGAAGSGGGGAAGSGASAGAGGSGGGSGRGGPSADAGRAGGPAAGAGLPMPSEPAGGGCSCRLDGAGPSEPGGAGTLAALAIALGLRIRGRRRRQAAGSRSGP